MVGRLSSGPTGHAPHEFFDAKSYQPMPQAPMICPFPECGQQFEDASSLAQHKRDCPHNKPFKCPECQQSFRRKDILTRHYRRWHTADRPHVCKVPKCGRRFAAPGDLRVHERRAHTGEKVHRCPYPGCSATFVCGYEIKVHKVRVHGAEKAFHCEVCNKSFTTVWELNQHKKRPIHIRQAELGAKNNVDNLINGTASSAANSNTNRQAAAGTQQSHAAQQQRHHQQQAQQQSHAASNAAMAAAAAAGVPGMHRLTDPGAISMRQQMADLTAMGASVHHPGMRHTDPLAMPFGAPGMHPADLSGQLRHTDPLGGMRPNEFGAPMHPGTAADPFRHTDFGAHLQYGTSSRQ
eukprot:Clim_evm2s1 gene=Clim_evmTU2s1